MNVVCSQARISLSYSRRGDVRIFLTSPTGTTSQLLPPRPKDHKEGGFDDWPFMSVFFWGEDPSGTWVLNVENVGSPLNVGVITKWQLVFFGTLDAPLTSSLNFTTPDDVTAEVNNTMVQLQLNETNEPIKVARKLEDGESSGDAVDALVSTSCE